MIQKIGGGTTTSNDAILNEFSEQNQHQSTKNNTVLNAKFDFFLCHQEANLMFLFGDRIQNDYNSLITDIDR